MKDALERPLIGIALILSGLGFLAVLSFMVWLLSRQGSVGLYRHGYKAPLRIIAVLGAIPPALSLAALFMTEKLPFLRSCLSSASSILGGLALVLVLGLFCFVFVNSTTLSLPIERPTLIAPALGFPPRQGQAVGSPEAFRIGISSDAHFGQAGTAEAQRDAILRAVEAESISGRLDGFFMLGDTVETGMSESGWIMASERMRSLGPHVAYRPLMGNRDAILNGQEHYQAYFMPREAAAGLGSPYYFRMDRGRVHILALNLLWGSESFDRSQRCWLVGELASIPEEDYTIVMSHCFLYASGSADPKRGLRWYDEPGILRDVAPLLEGKVDLVVSGHNHHMEWIESGGTAFALVGAMGGKPGPEPTHRSPGSVWLARDVYGWMDVELTEGSLACRFRDQGGDILFERTI